MLAAASLIPLMCVPVVPRCCPVGGVVVAVRVERLVVADPLGEVVARPVAGAVHAARFEEQRPELVAGDDVEENGAQVRRDFLGPDSVRARAVLDRLAGRFAPLIVKRRIQAEGAEPPGRVDADRVAIFVIGRAAGGAWVEGCPECGRSVERAARGAPVDQVAPGVMSTLAISA
jgi:hypothetical protein